MDAMTPPDMLSPEAVAAKWSIGSQPNPQAMMAQALQPAPKPVTHDVTIITTKKLQQAKVMGVPPEEFGIERGARNIRDCNYCFHEPPQTVGGLIDQGFDEDQVKGIASQSGAFGTEDLARDSVDEQSPAADSLNERARRIRVTEHYIRMDMDGKGRACIYRVTTAGEGGEILNREGKPDIERVDEYPFAATTPVPITHRFFGRSIADLVMQTQREKTALKRGALDNIYLHTNPRPVVSESGAGVNTIDDLLVSRHGAPIRTRVPGAIEWQVWPDITGSIGPLLQYLDADLAAKTGLDKQSQGIDANALQIQSATAVAQVFSASQMRMKLIARICAEGVKEMFSLLHGTIRRHGQKAQTVRLRNTWVEVDPRQWKTRNDMTIHVGLGTGGKAQQFAQIMALANFQKELLLGGKGHLVGDDKLYATGAELTKIMGHKNPNKFLDDPSEKDPKTGELMHPAPPPPEDPKVTALKLKAQLDEKALQGKAEIEKLQAQADIATQSQKTNAEIALADKKANLEAQLAILDHQMKVKEHELKVMELNHKMAAQQQLHEHKVKEGEMGLVATAVTHDAKMEQSAEAHDQKMAAAKATPKDGK